MTTRPTPVTLAMTSVLIVACLGVLGWSLEPENAGQWARRIIMLPALWGFLEFAQYRGEDRGERANSKEAVHGSRGGSTGGSNGGSGGDG